VYSALAWTSSDTEIPSGTRLPTRNGDSCYVYEETSPTREYHREHYGRDGEYERFIDGSVAENWELAGGRLRR